ncbi:MAG: Hpt domain-containing protein, partial [Aestuariivirga sp.]
MNDKLERFRTMFLDECDDHTRTLERTLAALQRGARSQDLVDDAFRAIHSIKGGAGMFGFDRIVPFAHVFETVLDGVRIGQIAITEDLMTAALRATDCLSDLILAAASNTDLAAGYENNMIGNLAILAGLTLGNVLPEAGAPKLAAGEKQALGPMTRLTIRFQPHAGLLKRANEPLFIVRQLRELGSLTISADISKLPPLGELQPTEAYLGWEFELETERNEAAVRDIFQFVEDDCDLTIEASTRNPSVMEEGPGSTALQHEPVMAEAVAST